MDAESRWWVAELFVADCEKAWLQKRKTTQKCCFWLVKMKQGDDKRKMEKSTKTESDDQERGRCDLLHEITTPRTWRGRAQILKEETQSCWTVGKQRGKNGQSIGNVTKACRMWRTSCVECQWGWGGVFKILVGASKIFVGTFEIFVGAFKIWALPLDPPPPDLPPLDLPPQDKPKFRFFSFRLTFHSFFVWALGRSCETPAASACIEISLNMGVHKRDKSGCKIGAKYNTEFGRVTWFASSHTFNFFVPRSSLRSAHDRIFNVQALPALLLHFVGHSPVLAATVCQYFPRNPAGMLVWHRLQRHLAHIRLRKEFASQFLHPPTLSVPSLFQGSTNPFNALENHRCPFSIATTTQTTKN